MTASNLFLLSSNLLKANYILIERLKLVMKKPIYLLVFFLVLLSCGESEDEQFSEKYFADGHYEGWFSYGERNYWCLIQFEDEWYEEWPSGGVMYQKSMACLTRGTYHVNGDELVFNPGAYKHEGFPDPCNTNTLLPGTYELFHTGRPDSLVFAKGEGENRIIYYVVNRTGGSE